MLRRKSVVALLGLFAAIAAAAYLASAAKADTPPKFVTNFYYNCLGDNNIGVPVGDDLVLDVAYGAKTQGLILDFMNGHTPMNVLLDGVPLANPEQYWGAPHLESGQWVVRWVYDTGWVSPAPVDSWHTINISTQATHRLTDGITILDNGTHKPVFINPGDPFITTFGDCSIGAF